MNPAPQELQLVPANPVEQVHVHAVLPTLDATNPPLLLQCVAVVHWVHVGYVMKPALQALQMVPTNPVEQVQVHAVLPMFDATDAAWLLQWVAVVHWTHVGYVI